MRFNLEILFQFRGAWSFDDILNAGGKKEREMLEQLSKDITPDDPVNIQFTSVCDYNTFIIKVRQMFSFREPLVTQKQLHFLTITLSTMLISLEFEQDFKNRYVMVFVDYILLVLFVVLFVVLFFLERNDMYTKSIISLFWMCSWCWGCTSSQAAVSFCFLLFKIYSKSLFSK